MVARRLLNVNSYHYRRGGSDVVYLDHGHQFEQLGWETAYFSMAHPKNLPSQWSRFFVDELEFDHEYTLTQRMLMASKVVYSFEAQRKLRALLQAFNPDVAHLHCIYHHLSPSILPILKSAGVRIVMTAHDLKVACPAYKMLNANGVCEACKSGSVMNVVRNRCVRGSLAASAVVAIESSLHRHLDTYRRHVDCLIAPSRFYQEKLIEWGWPIDKIRYVPNYVQSAPKVRPRGACDYFLYFGRLAPEKGISTLIKAAGLAGVRVVIAGTGPEEATLRGLAAEVNAAIEFVGFQSGEALLDLVAGARAVVLPSEWYENAPMSVLESFSLNVPVIGSAIGGIPEMLIEGETGWTFPPGDVFGLSRVIAQVASMPTSEVVALGERAGLFVAERFTRARYLSEMKRVYAELGVVEDREV